MNWFMALTLRERVLLIMVLPLAAIALSYQYAWKPLNETHKRYTSDIASYRLVTDTAALAKQPATQSTSVPIPAQNDVPLATRITSSGEAAGIVLRRIEPEGDGIRVTLADTSFAQLTLWLAEMEQDLAVVVTAIEIDRRPEPGTVSARILLTTL